MEHLRRVDFGAFALDRFSYQVLAETERCIIVVVRQPANGRIQALTPHYHTADQVFYMLEGSLEIDMDGVRHTADRDGTIFIPAGVVHGHVPIEDEMHIDIVSPAPTRGMPLGHRAHEEPSVFLRRPQNPCSPPIAVTPGKPRASGWVRPLEEVPFQETHVPGIDVRAVASRALGSEHICIHVCDVHPGPGPGPGPGPAWHIHEFDQFYYVLEGVLTVEVAHKSYEAQPHELMVIPAGVPHRSWNNRQSVERHVAILQPEPPDGVSPDLDVKFEVASS